MKDVQLLKSNQEALIKQESANSKELKAENKNIEALTNEQKELVSDY